MKFFILLALLISSIFANSYFIKFRGMTLGKIDTLDTLEQNYLKAKVSNSIVRMMLGHDYYVFYDKTKPSVEDAKFKDDNKKIIFALKEAIKSKPINNDYIINKDKHITLSCSGSLCKFDYYSHDVHKAQGEITFDSSGEFLKLVEKKSTLIIEKE